MYSISHESTMPFVILDADPVSLLAQWLREVLLLILDEEDGGDARDGLHGGQAEDQPGQEKNGQGQAALSIQTLVHQIKVGHV